jgi:signal recognition particle subunit SRP54
LKAQMGGNLQVDPKRLVRMRAILSSMTKEERRRPEILSGSRRRRIAAGSGTSVPEVNMLLKQFEQMKTMMGQMMSMEGGGHGKPGKLGKLGGPPGKRGGFPFPF